MKSIITKFGFGVCLAVLIAGCSPKMRLERIVRNHPEVIQNIQMDTLMTSYYDTFFVQIPGIDTTLYLTDTVLVHDSTGTITIYKMKEGKIRLITNFRPIIFPVEKKSIVINRKQTIAIADHPIDKWKFRKQGIHITLLVELILITLFFILKQYLKQFKLP